MGKPSASDDSTLIRRPATRSTSSRARRGDQTVSVERAALLSSEERRFGKYQLVKKLGSGGMADVWLARVEGPGGFEKDVVVKRVKPELVRKARAVEMFLREARTAAKLNHPNVVQIFDLGEQHVEGTGVEYYLAMELLDGLSWADVALRTWSTGEPLPLEVVLQAMVDALRGLEHAHGHVDREGRPAGLVHRDISPDNLFLTKTGLTKVLDFGIAKAMDGDVLTQSGELHGKVPYMPPEQLKGEPLDGRSDVWSLGMTLMWLTTGQRPFDRRTPMLTMQAIIDEKATPPSTMNPALPAAVDAIVARALAKRPADRYQSAAEMADAIEALLPPRSTAQEAVRLCASARAAPAVDEANVPVHAARPTSALLPTSRPRSTSDRTTEMTQEHPRPDGARRGLLYVAAGGAAAFVAATATMMWVAGPLAAPLAAPRAEAPVVAVSGDAAPVVAAKGDAAAPSADVPPSSEAPTPVVAEPSSSAAPSSSEAPSSGEAPAPVVVAPPVKRAAVKPRPAPVASSSIVASSTAAVPVAPAPPVDPNWISLAVSAPPSIEWTCPQGRHLGDGSGTLRFHKLITTVYAVDKARGVRTRFDVKAGVADYTRVPRARLSITAAPGAQVFVGGERVGTGPAVAVDVVAGAYVVKAVKDGAAGTAQVTIEAGRPAAVRIE